MWLFILLVATILVLNIYQNVFKHEQNDDPSQTDQGQTAPNTKSLHLQDSHNCGRVYISQTSHLTSTRIPDHIRDPRLEN
jgi:hypothetical protein